MANSKPKILGVDGRRRISLGKLATSELYLVRTDPDGTIVLTPAVAMKVVKNLVTDEEVPVE